MRKQRGEASRKKDVRIVRTQDRHHRKKIIASQYGGLQIVADQLNELPYIEAQLCDQEIQGPLKEQFEGWSLAKEIVSLPLDQRAGVFTKHAKQHPVNMYVEYPIKQLEEVTLIQPTRKEAERKKWPLTLVESRDEIGTVLWHLWLFYFRDYGWERLKNCPVCGTWFVDTSKNRATARCSEPCTWRWWSRQRRKEMHTSKKGVKHGTQAR
jgi:hypothetical protein